MNAQALGLPKADSALIRSSLFHHLYRFFCPSLVH
jgi:hypothetical protein